jgi:hypothetical protein
MKTKKLEVVILSTKEESNLGFLNKKLYISTFGSSSDDWENKHIYLVSKEETKGGDWIYNSNTDRVGKTTNYTSGIYKIIATTDDLKINKFKSGVFSDLEYKLPSISKSDIDWYVSEYNKGNVIKEVYVEMIDNGEEGWHGSNEDGQPVWNEKWEIKTNNDNTVIINKNTESKEMFKRASAMSWWNTLSSLRKTQLCDTNTDLVGSIRRWETLTGREVENIWEKENKKESLRN